MGEEWEQTLCAMGEAPSFSNPVQRYGERLIRASIIAKKCNEANRTKIINYLKDSAICRFCRLSIPRRLRKNSYY